MSVDDYSLICSIIFILLAATKQLYEWLSPSVRLSVCDTFFTMFHHRIIMKFSGVITNDRSDVHAKGQGQRSRSQRSQPNFTNDYEMVDKAWCCLGQVPYCFSRSSVKFQGHTAKKIVEIDPGWAFPGCNFSLNNSSLNSPMAPKWCTKL